jgi:cellulose synthase/poly-beta-1,6-N-acetylglucosamine synthase-like glycosyltransferase
VDAAAFAHALAAEVRANGHRWLVSDYLGHANARPGASAATVAICTRERPADLRRALAAVRRLDPPPLEVLVIDNAPHTSATRAVAAECPGVRYVCEPRQGLDFARNRALHDASGDIVAFCDDDAMPEPQWLGALVRPFEDRRIWCTTGLTLAAELETDAQEWFERYSSFTRGFRQRLFEGASHDTFSVGTIGAGANMAVRREVLETLGGFDTALDAGTPTRSGGDHDLFGRILAAGYNIFYEPSAVSWHRHRRTWPELRETLRGYGTGVSALATRRALTDREPGALRHAARWFVRHHARALWRAARRHPDAVPFDLIRAEIGGWLAGPAAYARSLRALRHRTS